MIHHYFPVIISILIINEVKINYTVEEIKEYNYFTLTQNKKYGVIDKTGNIIINSDVNGSYNILRKFDNNLFSKDNLDNILTIPKIININGYINKKKKLA